MTAEAKRRDAALGANLHVVERFTRVGRDGILYQFTVEDPATWAQPWHPYS